MEGIGAGFRSRLFLPMWTRVQESLRGVECKHFDVLRVRLIIDAVSKGRSVLGFEGVDKFVVENRIPIDDFKKLSIQEKNHLVLDAIFESIKAAYANFDESFPEQINRIWREVRESA